MSYVYPYQGKVPKIDATAFVAPNAAIVGDVTLGQGVSVWFGVTIRGDFQPIVIGDYTNIQDGATIHVMGDVPTEIGDFVTIGHNSLIHCRRIGNNCLIGMGSIILGYSEIGQDSIIGAGTLLTQHKKIPHNSLVFGNPARIVRSLREDEIEAVRESAINYHDIATLYANDVRTELL